MPLINHSKKEINAKLVFIGPAEAGKDTNLRVIFCKLKESFRGTFKGMNLDNDRLLFFDFMPSGQGDVQGYKIRFHVYTITGAVAKAASWKMLLKGVDGLVFVADSDPDKKHDNQHCMEELKEILTASGKTISDIPVVIQYNKRDMATAVDLEQLNSDLNPENNPHVPAVACKGEGVLESVFSLLKMVVKNIREMDVALGEEISFYTETGEHTLPEKQPFAEPEMDAFDPEADKVSVVDKIAGFEYIEETQEKPVLEEYSPVEDELEGDQGVELEPGSNQDEVVLDRLTDEMEEKLPEEPMVEVAGGPELLEGGGVRVPLSIKYDGKIKRMTLDISLYPET